jgi:hypothetical protein
VSWELNACTGRTVEDSKRSAPASLGLEWNWEEEKISENSHIGRLEDRRMDDCFRKEIENSPLCIQHFSYTRIENAK